MADIFISHISEGAAEAHALAEIIPIAWDMPPEDLTPDLQRRQAVVLTGETPDRVNQQVNQLITAGRCVRRSGESRRSQASWFVLSPLFSWAIAKKTRPARDDGAYGAIGRTPYAACC